MKTTVKYKKKNIFKPDTDLINPMQKKKSYELTLAIF